MLTHFLTELERAMRAEKLLVTPGQLADAARYILVSNALFPDDSLPESLKPILVTQVADELPYAKAWRRLWQQHDRDGSGKNLLCYNILRGKPITTVASDRRPMPQAATGQGLNWQPWQKFQEYRQGGSQDVFEHATMEALARNQQTDEWEAALKEKLTQEFLANGEPAAMSSLLEAALAFRKEFARLQREWNKVMATVSPSQSQAAGNSKGVKRLGDKSGEKQGRRPEFTQGWRANVQRWGDPELFTSPMEELDAQESRALEGPIRAMAERLRIRMETMHKRSCGKIDICKTMRASRKTFGEPIRIIPSRPRRRPARWIVLADISGSVKYATQLFLTFLSELRYVLDEHLRGFVFISRIYEVSHLLQQRNVGNLPGRISQESGLDFRGYSDYGVAFEEFSKQASDDLDRETVLLILGDARTNKRNPRRDLVQQWSNRARKVIWFNPELPEKWDNGDSVIGLYATAISRVYDISTPGKLLHAMEKVTG